MPLTIGHAKVVVEMQGTRSWPAILLGQEPPTREMLNPDERGDQVEVQVGPVLVLSDLVEGVHQKEHPAPRPHGRGAGLAVMTFLAFRNSVSSASHSPQQDSQRYKEHGRQ